MNRFDADAKFRRAVALEQVEKPAPSQRVKSYSHTSQYEHSSDVGFVTSTSDHFAAGVTIEELLDVSRDAAAVTVWALSGVIGLLLQVFLLAVVVVVVVLGGCLSAPRGIRGCSVITAAGAAIVSCGTIVGHSISVLLVPVHGLEEGHASRDGARHGAQDPGRGCPGLWLCPVLGSLREREGRRREQEARWWLSHESAHLIPCLYVGVCVWHSPVHARRDACYEIQVCSLFCQCIMRTGGRGGRRGRRGRSYTQTRSNVP